MTKSLIKKLVKKDHNIFNIFQRLSKKYKIAVATNAIRDTLDDCLEILNINQYVSYSVSNDEVRYTKPNPQIYLKCMSFFGISPDETLILEDSPVGRKSALASKAKLFPIENKSLPELTFPSETNIDKFSWLFIIIFSNSILSFSND